MTETVVATSHNNLNMSIFSKSLQRNLVLGATMPFSTRAFVEVTAWRELKYLDGSLNIAHKVLASAASAVIAIVSLVEAAVRYTFCLLLLPMGMMGNKWNERYTAFLNGALFNTAIPLLAVVGTIGFLLPVNVLSKSDDEGKSKEAVDRNEIQSERDAFRGKFYEYTIDHEKNSITYKDAQI